MGLKEIFGEASVVKAKLGVVESPRDNDDERAILDILRSDLALIDLVDLISVAPKDVKSWADQRLEIKANRSNKGVLVSAVISAGKEVVASRNFWDQGNTRRLGHKTAEFALKTLTGEQGFFTSKIAFTLKQGGKKEVWLADWDGKNAGPITNWSTISLLPAFSHDGRRLAFTSYKDGNPDLYAHDLDKGSIATLSEAQGLNASAAFDPLGEGLLATLSLGRDPNIYFLSPQGKILRRLTRTMGIDTAATFSPNGQEIAFTTDRSGNPQIFIMNRDGANTRRLTYGFFWADEPEWSRDGSAVAFSGKKVREENFQVFLGDPMGARFVQLTTDGANEHPTFSHDSRFISFTSKRNGKWEVFIKGIARETPEMRVIAFQGADCLEPAWSASEPAP